MDLDDIINILKLQPILSPRSNSAGVSTSRNGNTSNSASISTAPSRNRITANISARPASSTSNTGGVSAVSGTPIEKKVMPNYFFALPNNDKDMPRRVSDEVSSKTFGEVPKHCTVQERLRLAYSNKTAAVKHTRSPIPLFDSSNEDDFGTEKVKFGKLIPDNKLQVDPFLGIAGSSKQTTDNNSGKKVDYKQLPNLTQLKNDGGVNLNNNNAKNKRIARARTKNAVKINSNKNTVSETRNTSSFKEIDHNIQKTKPDIKRGIIAFNDTVSNINKSDNTKIFQKKPNQPDSYITLPFGKNHELKNQNENMKMKVKKPFVIPKKDVNMPTGKIVAITLPSKPRCICAKLSETKYIPIKPDNEEYQVIVDEMNNTIRKHVSGSFNNCKIKSIKKIKNCCLWMRYMNRQRDIAKEHEEVNEVMLFHGSMACDEICKSGFDERHSNQGGMFGAGVYFAKHSSKSNQYVFGYMGGNGCPLHKLSSCTTCIRKMLLCRVTLGNTKKLTSSNKMSHAPPGFHSVSGVPSPGGLLYEEYIIYRGEQAYPEYEIAYTIQ